ncbi:50S ribosomal protein L44e [Candidatus Woesearchaeota archaeon]|nr:50S ribosomal protein L44e [Candidatus Woesearchaeota archaeon]
MKVPKIRNTFCKTCKKHTEHKVAESKKKTPFTAHPMGYGNKKTRAKLRGVRGHGNLGRYSKPPINKWKLAGKKQSKKTDFRLTCKVCNKSSTQRMGIRAKKVEFV